MTATLETAAATSARTVVTELIAPAATLVDRTAVPAGHLAALAAAGWLGWEIPTRAGGTTPPPDHVELDALLAGACPSTHLIVSQHSTPVRALLRAGHATDFGAFARGERLGGAAFGHVRAWPERAWIRATRTGDGYRLTGTAPWMSGDGLVTDLYVGAVDEQAQEFVFAVVPLPDPAIRSEPLELAAVVGSRTVALGFDDLHVPLGAVVERIPVTDWKAKDGAEGPLTYPGTVGLARAAVTDALARFPLDPALQRLAAEVEELATQVPEQGLSRQERALARARSIDLTTRATRAAVVAAGGAGLLAGHIAQVRARAALFLHVRGLGAELRAAHFEVVAP